MLLCYFRTLCAIGSAILAVKGVPAAVGVLGFGASGVATGTWAAWLMGLYGGAVPAGGVVAALQGIGAAGLGAVGQTIAGTVGAIAGYVAALFA